MSQPPAHIGPFTIGPWHVDADAHELIGANQTLRLPPKTIAVLVKLFERRGTTVSREALMDHAGLSDEGLSRVMTELRKALGDDVKAPRYVKTVPRAGYRLLAEAVQSHEDRPAARRRLAGIGIGAIAGLAGLLAWWFQATEPLPGGGTELILSGFPEDATRPAAVGDWVFFKRYSDPSAIWRVHRQTLQTELVADDPAIMFYRPDPPRARIGQIRRQDNRCVVELIEGQSRRTVGACRIGTEGSPLDFTPEGQMVFARAPGPGEDHGLDVYDPATAATRRLTAAPPGQWDASPQVSPDGQWVSFSRGDQTIRELFVVGLAEGDELRQLSFDRQKVFGADWTTERCLVVATDRSAHRLLWEWSLDGVIEPEIGGIDAYGVIAVDGGAVFERPFFRADIFAVSADGQHPLIAADRYDNHPRYSPAGDHIAFISNRDGTLSIWLSAADGSRQRRVFSADQGARLTRPYWIDETHLAAVRFRDQISEAIVIDVDSGESQLLIDSSWLPTQVIATPDGALWFIGQQGNQAGIYRQSGTGTQRVAESAYLQLEYGNGTLYALPAEGDLLVMVNSDGQTAPVSIPVIGTLVAFAVRGNRIVYADETGTHLLDLAIHEPVFTYEAIPQAIGLTLDISPIEDAIAWTTTTNRRVDLVELQTEFRCR